MGKSNKTNIKMVYCCARWQKVDIRIKDNQCKYCLNPLIYKKGVNHYVDNNRKAL